MAILDIVTGQTVFDRMDMNAMLPPLKEKACELGADALFIRNVEAGGNPWLHPTEGKASSTAIKLLDIN